MGRGAWRSCSPDDRWCSRVTPLVSDSGAISRRTVHEVPLGEPSLLTLDDQHGLSEQDEEVLLLREAVALSGLVHPARVSCVEHKPARGGRDGAGSGVIQPRL
jgi:hypothetical protein